MCFGFRTRLPIYSSRVRPDVEGEWGIISGEHVLVGRFGVHRRDERDEVR